MSWLSNAIHGVEHGISHAAEQVGKGVKGVGHELGSVASNPWVDAALAAGLGLTGVGAVPAALIMAGTKGIGNAIKPGGNLGSGLVGAAEGAAEGYGGSKIGAALKGGLGSVGTDIGNNDWLQAAKDSAGTIGKTLGVTGGGGAGSGGGGGILGSGLMKDALLAASVASAAADRQQQNKYLTQGVNDAQNAWNAQAPVRAQAIAEMTNPGSTPMSRIYSDPGNIYSKFPPPGGTPTGQFSQATQAAAGL